GLPEAVPQVIPARVRDALRPSPACPLSGSSLSDPGRGVPDLSHARSSGVLQQGRYLGDRTRPVQPIWATGTSSANLRCGYLAWRERTRVPLDSAFYPTGQGQFDRLDGRS